MGYSGPTFAPQGRPFPLTKVGPFPDGQPADMIRRDAGGFRDAGDAGDCGEQNASRNASDAGAAWRQIGWMPDRLEFVRGFGDVLRAHSSELTDRSRVLQSRSVGLRHRLEALRAQIAGACARAALAAGPHVGADPKIAEVPLLGGDMTEGVVRVGRTVRRPVRLHTPAVHALLQYLEAAGFEGAPRVLGIDAMNREVLTYLPGVVTRRPLPGFITAESALVSLAQLQLRYHEAVVGFDPPSWAQWDGELTRFVDGPPEIICHCDVNLENVIFRPGPDGPQPYAFIDFDLARPGTRLVDIIQTLRYWGPIADPADRDPALRNADVPRRIAVFCEAYGLSCTERARLVPVASRWLRRSRATIAQRARTCGGAWARMQDAGVRDRLLRSAVWLERNRPEIEALLRRPSRRAP